MSDVKRGSMPKGRESGTGSGKGSNFVDECSICVQGGNGGMGCVSFRREAQVSRGGPDGGDGGDGGDVWLVADHNVSSLLAFRDHPHRRAGHGAHGMGKKRHGAKGQDCLVSVPEGTVIRSQDGEVLADLQETGDRWKAARGGDGGKGNAKFLSNRRRAPAFAELLEKGEERWLRLELKLLADVALVGFPNAGKSTLISRISAAKPKIADYPFTTLEPNLGVVRWEESGNLADDRHGNYGIADFVVADVPGLIEGASEGVGLGTRFLRHIERARVLVFLLDPASEASLSAQREVLLGELRSYDTDLLVRPRIFAVSKSDLLAGLPEEVRQEVKEISALVISAATGDGMENLVQQMGEAVLEAKEAETLSLRTGTSASSLSADASVDASGKSPRVLHKLMPEGVKVERESDGSWRLAGREAERAVALTDLSLPEAMTCALERLEKLGADKLLRRAGIQDGQNVKVSNVEFIYRDDALLDVLPAEVE